MNIFGIKISNIKKDEVLKKIGDFLVDGKQHYLVTPNPEILLQAGEDEELFYILNHADLAIPDGIGLKFAGWFLGENLKRITGADLVLKILKSAGEKNLKVGIVNWNKGLSNKKDISNSLKQKYPKLNFAVEDVNREEAKLPIGSLASDFLNFNPDILFAALGAPYQEKFIFHNLKKLPSVKLAIGVGGSFDYITEKARRAPKIMRNLGLEWLWRLCGIFSGQKDYNRKKRILKAIFAFPWKFIKWRIILPFLYRNNVACLMYKREGNKYKIFLVKRQNAKDEHWQLPQGGIDKSENLFTAGKRELREEAGTDKFKAVMAEKNLHKYTFDKKISKEEKQMHTGYKGQKQSLFIAEFLGKDEDIKINFWDHLGWKWVDAEKLVREVYFLRQPAAKIYLEKFNTVIASPETSGRSNL
ncbi:MAG: WecB/TagA/CpsF family glycosyltransferase [Patescibacteria group bacterium]|nr:WecB/TagA/CpsF family glycosyltransferase [Patescibacteria group bacterium]MDD4610343.1 WecB/TagA/CpsF family glycosyltransferase [Patescibacteria group bacterium]